MPKRCGALETDLRVEPLSQDHGRAEFSCGEESLDRYLKTQARQDARRRFNAVFVMVGADQPTRILGYFSLSAYSLPREQIPEEIRNRLPRHDQVSAMLIGQFAVAREHQGRGLGAVLLDRALVRAYESADAVGASLVVVDALNDAAASFYRAFGFLSLADTKRLILPMWSAKRLAES